MNLRPDHHASLDSFECPTPGEPFSEDMHDGQPLGGVTIVNPFAPKNAVLLAAVLP